VPRRATQRRASTRRRRRRLGRLLAAALGIAVLVTGIIAESKGKTPPVPAARPLAAHRHRSMPSLRPPGPIPGYLLIADRGNNRMLLVDGSGRVYWRYPRGAPAAMPFVFDDDTFFSPNLRAVISNQEDQDTIQVISFPQGRLLWHYGHANVKSGQPGYLNTPDDAYLLPSRMISVADAYNCRVLFISPAHRIVRQYGTTGVCRHDPPRYLGAVNGATPLADGGTLVSEINGSWIDDIGPAGRLRWATSAPVSYPSDPQLIAPGRILLADYSKPGAALIMTPRGRVLWRYGPASGPGELDHPSLATRIAPGLIAINDDFRDRVVIVSVRTHRIVWQYGHTDRPGRADGYLNTPDGLDLLGTAEARRLPRLVHLLSRRPTARATARRRGLLLETLGTFGLPAPVQREVVAAVGGRIVIAGGLDATSASTNGVFSLDPHTHALTRLGSVPNVFHDAAGAVLGSSLFVFGGGAASSSAAVQRFDLATHKGSVVGNLPRPLSDVSSATTGGAVYLIGGYDGRTPQRTVYRTVDGRHFTVVATLPIGLRYPAVAAVGPRIVIAGGTTANGPSERVYVFDTRANSVRPIGRLPVATAGAAAFALGSRVYVAGGTGGGTTAAIDPAAGNVTPVAGKLLVSNAGAVVIGHAAYIVGGASSTGTTGTVRRVLAARG
jgi:Kelch motif